MKTTANIGGSQNKAGNGQSCVTDRGITYCIMKRMEMNCYTKGIGTFTSGGFIPEEATGKAFASNCDFGCISMHDLTAFCACMWHKLLAFCIYVMSPVTVNAALLPLNWCKKQLCASIITFIGLAGAVGTVLKNFVTNECITNSFTAKLTTMKHTITHFLSSVSHLLAPHMTPLKVQRRRFIKRSYTFIMLAVVFIVPIIAGSPQVSLQFCFLLLSSLYNISAHASYLSVCN